MADLVGDVYLPRLKAKFQAPFVYNGVNHETYQSYAPVEQKDQIFSDKTRDRSKVILGIESSFNDSAACLVNSFGEIVSENVKYSIETMTESSSAGVDPACSQRFHEEHLPKAIDRALAGCDLNYLEAIAVTLGPGQIQGLKVGNQVALETGRRLGVPVIPINHIEAHVMTPRFANQGDNGPVP